MVQGASLEVPPAGELPGGGGFPGLGPYLALMRRCWDKDPARRPASFAEIIAALRWVLLLCEGSLASIVWLEKGWLTPLANGCRVMPVV